MLRSSSWRSTDSASYGTVSYIHVGRQTALEQLVLGVAILLTPLSALFQNIVENGKLADEDYNARFVESRRHGEGLQ